jgi:hypothetical protein
MITQRPAAKSVTAAFVQAPRLGTKPEIFGRKPE